MKKKLLCLLALICVPLAASCGARRAKNAGYAVYRSSPVGVEVEYPEFWELAEDKKERTVAFVTPSEGFGEDYRDNVSICSYELDDKENAFDNYVTDYVDSLPSTISGYVLVSEGSYPVGEYDSYRIVYEGETGEGVLRLQQTFINSGKYVYIYSFIAEPKSYDYFNANSEVMLSTFKALSK